MGNKAKRPISVWIAQGFLVFFLLAIVLAFSLVMMKTQPSERSSVGVVFTSITSLVLIAVDVIAFWGMAARKAYGRWLGVTVMSFMLIFENVSKILFPSNSAETMSALIIRVLFSIFLLIVVLHIALSEKVEAFFARKIEPTRFDQPPPPPSFND